MDQSTSVEESVVKDRTVEQPSPVKKAGEKVIHVKDVGNKKVIEVRVPLVNTNKAEREKKIQEEVMIEVQKMDKEKEAQTTDLLEDDDIRLLDDSKEVAETSMDVTTDITRSEELSGDEEFDEEVDDEDDDDDEEDDGLFPFVCGICDYRFNRIDVYYRHFQMHSDMVTEEYFHPCLEEDGEVKISPVSGEMSRDIFKCGACSIEFPTLCSLHEHLSQNPATKLYIVDIGEKKAIPKGKKCVGSIMNGINEINYDEGTAVLKKPEAEEVYDDDEEGTNGDDDSALTTAKESDVIGVNAAGSQTDDIDQNISQDDTSNADKKAGIQRITVNYGSRKETFVVQKNMEDASEQAEMGSESEADMDMSDIEVEDHSYDQSNTSKENRKKKTSQKIKSEQSDYSFFTEYEDEVGDRERVRGKLIKIESPQVLRELADSAKYAEGEGDNVKVHCPVCEKIVHQQYVTKHIKKCHADERCACDICGKVFANRGYLKDHKRFVHEGIRKKPMIKLEGSTAQKADNPDMQELRVFGDDLGPNMKVYCPTCDKPILKTYLQRHIAKVHSEKNVGCDICGRLFTNRGYLADHKRYMHEGKRKRSVIMRLKAKEDGVQTPEENTPSKVKVNCPKCPKVVLQDYLSKHLRQAHSDQECPCDVCGKVFACPRFLNDHKRCVHTEYNTECEVCNKMFKGKSAKEKHKKMVHSDALPHECVQCARRFRSNVEYSRHMTTHKDQGVYCYQCPRCERRFKSQKAMNYHDRSVHKRIGRLQCKWPGCGRILNDRASFKKHYLIHTGDRPNKCPHCDRAFIQRVALKYHLRKEHSIHELPPGHIPCHRRETDIKIEPDDHAVAVPLYVQEEDGTEDYSEMEVVQQAISEAATVDISDSAIVSDLIQIAQSSEGAVVPEALQHVFDGNNKTIVIYYQ